MHVIFGRKYFSWHTDVKRASVSGSNGRAYVINVMLSERETNFRGGQLQVGARLPDVRIGDAYICTLFASRTETAPHAWTARRLR